MEGIHNGDLSADDLEKLAGGVDTTNFVLPSIVGSSAAAGAAI